jgi:hypothetical protein
LVYIIDTDVISMEMVGLWERGRKKKMGEYADKRRKGFVAEPRRPRASDMQERTGFRRAEGNK